MATTPTTPAKTRTVYVQTPVKTPTPILSRTSSYNTTSDSPSRSPTRSRSPAIRFPKLHDDSEDEATTGAQSDRTHPVVAPVFFINPTVQRRGRSSTVGSVASFVQRRPASAVSILLGILFGIALVLAVVGLIMLIFVVNSGGLLGGSGYAVEGGQTEGLRMWASKHEASSPVFRHLSSLFATRPFSTTTATSNNGLNTRSTVLASPASGLVGTGSSSPGESTVFVVKTSRIHASRPASFGPHIMEQEGRIGWLAPMEVVLLGYDALTKSLESEVDEDKVQRARRGCPSSDEEADKQNGTALAPPSTGWVALMERGSCPFATKIRYAQSLGASAVIVGDWSDVSTTASTSLSRSRFSFSDSWDWDFMEFESVEADDGSGGGTLAGFGSGLITMYAPGDTSDIHIPSVFVARESFVSFRKDWEDEGTVGGEVKGDEAEKEKERVKSLQVVMSRDEMWSWCVRPFAHLLRLGADPCGGFDAQAVPRHPHRASLPPVDPHLLHPARPPYRRLPSSQSRSSAKGIGRQPAFCRLEQGHGEGRAGHGSRRRSATSGHRQGRRRGPCRRRRRWRSRRRADRSRGDRETSAGMVEASHAEVAATAGGRGDRA